MKKIVLLFATILSVTSLAWSDSSDELERVTRIGGLFTTESVAAPSSEQIYRSFANGVGILPGIELELLNRNFGFIARTGLMFLDYDDDVSGRTWDLDVRQEFGFRFHLFGWNSFLDPFAELHAGVGLKEDITAGREPTYIPRSRQLSWYGGVSGGLNLVFGNVYLGGSLRYDPVSGPVPLTDFEPYDVGKFGFTLHVGYNAQTRYRQTLFGRERL